MKKHAKILVAIVFILGLSGAAKAESQGGVVVTLPFKFVVGRKTLPAGTYTVRNASDDPSGPLIITNHDSSKSVLVLPYVNESASTEKPELEFQQGGDEHFLSTIHTSWRIYRIPVSQSAFTEAVAASRNDAPVSGGSE
ncbi:MAG TPA: hypothetical protein VK578_02830 [Edaphobacter sp.]|nr:hypothetical protein [Edaphobacter sp.]